MPFIIRAFDKVAGLGWVTPPNDRGFRTIGSRPAAEIFQKTENAKSVMARMPSTIAKVRVEYSVETIDPPTEA